MAVKRFDRPRDGAPIALTIAGSDSGGGAGIQADLKTFSALQVFGASVITAVTAQNTRQVTAVHDIPANIVVAQLRAVLDDLDVGAIKIGMLSSPGIIDAVADVLGELAVPIVLDPVMVAKSGDKLLADDAVECLISRLVGLATVLTPNLPEAARLLQQATVADDTLESQAGALLALGPKAVLLKGGHGSGPVCKDLLVNAAGSSTWYEVPRILTSNTHGTGCTLSSAIAAGLAKGCSVDRAIADAHSYLNQAIGAADRLQIGAGHGPVHHFHASWDVA